MNEGQKEIKDRKKSIDKWKKTKDRRKKSEIEIIAALLSACCYSFKFSILI